MGEDIRKLPSPGSWGSLLTPTANGFCRTGLTAGCVVGRSKANSSRHGTRLRQRTLQGRRIPGGRARRDRKWEARDISGPAMATCRWCSEKAGTDLFIKDVDSLRQRFVTALNGDDHALEVWTAAGVRQAALSADRKHYWSAAFSPDGRLVCGGCEDGVVRIWEWEPNRLVLELHGHSRTVDSVAFHPVDGASLLTTSHGKSIRLWSLASPIIRPLRGCRTYSRHRKFRRPVDKLWREGRRNAPAESRRRGDRIGREADRDSARSIVQRYVADAGPPSRRSFMASAPNSGPFGCLPPDALAQFACGS